MTPTLPQEDSPLVRTSFTSDAAWDALCAAIAQPNSDGFRAYVSTVNDKAWEATTPRALANAAKADNVNALVAFIADAEAMEGTDMPVLVVELDAERAETDEPRTFRCIVRELWSVENNLNLANMGWDDFADSLEDGVYRGFGDADGVQQGESAPPMALGAADPGGASTLE